MHEESQALTPVYLLSLYGKWQKLNMIETMKKFIGDGIAYPMTRLSVFAAFGSYFLALFGMVKFLRRDFRTNR